jgi:3'(2'), 5'-bisphosphate nucleotidase
MTQLDFLSNNAAKLVGIAKEAGRRIVSIKNNAQMQVAKKSDESPVTAADVAASDFIIESLFQLTPTIPAVSEEKIVHVSDKDSMYWLIDPLDGTREFIKGSSEYTVNIALVRDRKPVFGVIFVPETNEVFVGGQTVSAFRIDSNGTMHALKTRDLDLSSPACLISVSHKSDEEQICRKLFQNLIVENVGSSLKYVRIASGQSDFSFRKTPTSIWDTAAAHAILIAAGGEMYGPGGKVLVYDPSILENPPFIAVGQPSNGWAELIAKL